MNHTFSVSLVVTVHDAPSAQEAAREFFRQTGAIPDKWGSTVRVDTGSEYLLISVTPEELGM
jgi:ribosomal protein S19